MKSKVRLLLPLSMLTLVFLISCNKPNIESTSPTQESARFDCTLKWPVYPEGVLVKPGLPILNKLCLTERPSLGKPFTVKFVFKYDRGYADRPNEQKIANATIYIPDGLSLVEGSLQWTGTLTEKQEQSVEVKVKASEMGIYTIGASTYLKDVGGIGDYFYLNVTPNGIKIIDDYTNLDGTSAETSKPPKETIRT